MARADAEPRNPDLPPEEGLRDGLRSGDPVALRTLIGIYRPALLRYANGRHDGNIDADEVVQEAFVRLWAKRDRWRADGSLKVLLFTLTRNAAVDAFRRTRRETRLSDHRMESFPSPTSNPEELVLEAELDSLVESAVANLPARRQEVFRLVRENGFSYRQVSEILKISSQTVANLMSLALADLRASLRPFLKTRPVDDPTRVERGVDAKASGSD